MKYSRLPIICLVFGLLLVSLEVVSAKGPPDKVVVSGPGLKGEVVVSEKAILQDLGPGSLENFVGSAIMAPGNDVESTAKYTMVRYMNNGEGGTFAFDRLHYYRDPVGSLGYIFYEGLSFNGRWSEYDGKWFRATHKGDAAMQSLLARLRPTTGLIRLGVFRPYWIVVLLMLCVLLALTYRRIPARLRPV